MQSNLAIAEELLRISAFLEPDWPACPRPTCELYGKSGDEFHARYTRYGTNGNGTPRYKCMACSKIFSHGGKSDKRQRETHKNRDIFLHLVNTVPIRRLIKLLDLSTSVLYSRLDFIHRQCTAFVGDRERTLVERSDLGKRYLSTDRQKLMVNWSSRNERKNTLILSMATADQVTGYVYGVHLNFDSTLNSEDVDKDSVRFGDHHLDPPFRRYARVWLDADHEAAATASHAETQKVGVQRGHCGRNIKRTRSPPVSRNDTETPLVAVTSMPVMVRRSTLVRPPQVFYFTSPASTRCLPASVIC